MSACVEDKSGTAGAFGSDSGFLQLASRYVRFIVKATRCPSLEMAGFMQRFEEP